MTNGAVYGTNGSGLIPCWHCGGEAEVSYGVGDYDYDGGDRWRFYRAKVVCRCGSELRVENDGDEYLPLERALDFAIKAWNTRVAVTDHDFAMAVHDGNLWGKCSECKERQGYYLDAETIRNQQEHITELQRENEEVLEAWANQAATIKEQIDGLHARDELIRDLARRIPWSSAFYDGTWHRSPSDEVLAARIRELGIEV